MDSIKGAILLRERLDESTPRKTTPPVPLEAAPIYHWVGVAPADGQPHAAETPSPAG